MNATKELNLGPIGQILISVKDVGRALAFYRDVLGIKFLFQAPGMAFFDAGGTRLYLGIPEKPEFDHTSILYFRVPDIRSAAAALEERGVRFTTPPHKVHRSETHELWLGSFHDSEGNTMALMSEVPVGNA